MPRIAKLSSILFYLFSTPVFCSGFYVGTGLGPDNANFEQNAHLTQGTTSNVIDKTHLSGLGVFGTIFGGYALIHNNFYLAGELNANISSVDFESSNSEFVHQSFTSTHYKMNRTCGISILPGIFYSDATLFYGRLGYANSNFKVTTSDTSLANINTNLGGFRFGAGIKQAIFKNLAVRLEYSQVNYQGTTMHVITSPIVKDTTITPQTGQVEFGVVYSF